MNSYLHAIDLAIIFRPFTFNKNASQIFEILLIRCWYSLHLRSSKILPLILPFHIQRSKLIHLLSLKHNFLSFIFQKVLKIYWIFYRILLSHFIMRLITSIYDHFLLFRYFHNTIIQILIFQVIVFLKLGLVRISTIQNKILFFLDKYFFLLWSFYWW